MLNKEQIMARIKEAHLVEGFIDLESQLTPNGFDLTAGVVFEFLGQGSVDFSNKERKLPLEKELLPVKDNVQDAHGWWQLAPGVYKIKTNEIVRMPKDLIGLAYTRTTLLRMGASTQHGIWDAGFEGKSEFVLLVQNPFGLRLKQNARVAQLVFVPVKEVAQGYQGIYQGTR